MADLAKIRREAIRWMVLLTLNNASPMGAFESIVLSVVSSEYPDATRDEVRKNLDYLEMRGLITIERHPDNRWYCKLARAGMDVVEYTVDVDPGIARPEKYFNA